MIQSENIGVGELAAVITIFGAIAALAATDDTASEVPVFTVGDSDVDPSSGQTVSEDTPGATPSDDGTWQVPDNVEQGGEEGSLWAGEGSGFNPEQRTDLVNDPSTVDGEEQEHTWVGL